MEFEILTGLAAFSFASSITPGPNNLMLMASGANYGFRRTIPHMLGVGIGFVFMVVMVGVGLVQVFNTIPASYTALKVISVVYLLYLAAKIATAAPPAEGASAQGKPFTFLQAAAFQWVNPKGWAMALTAVGAYAPSADPVSLVLVALLFGAVNLPSTGLWAVLGDRLAGAIADPARMRGINLVLAVLLLASTAPLLVG